MCVYPSLGQSFPMPVQMVCNSTSLVSAALRDSLTSSTTSSSSGIGGSGASTSGNSPASTSSLLAACSPANRSEYLDPEEDFNLIENGLTAAIKQNQQCPIRYEEVSNYSNELDNVKLKYILLKPTTTSSHNGINGSDNVSGAGTSNSNCTNTNGLFMNGTTSSTMATKLSADTTNNVATSNSTNYQSK